MARRSDAGVAIPDGQAPARRRFALGVAPGTGETGRVSWSTADIPPLDGRVALITGANGGIGLAVTRALAAHGATVVLAARDEAKASSAREAVLRDQPDARLETLALDLASLASVADAARSFLTGHDRLDVLLANAGVMALPEGRTEDGFELQLGVNHLGHWALTSHLLPAIVRTPGARVVTVTSFLQHLGRGLNPDDPHLRRHYDAWASYNRSKLANRHFAQGLDRRLRAAGVDASALVAHPGLSRSGLQAKTVEAGGGGLIGSVSNRVVRLIGMDVARGALSLLRAATDPAARGGTMYGPLFMVSGPPVRKPLVRPGTDAAIATLWEVSRRETGLDVDVPEAVRRADSE